MTKKRVKKALGRVVKSTDMPDLAKRFFNQTISTSYYSKANGYENQTS